MRQIDLRKIPTRLKGACRPVIRDKRWESASLATLGYV